MNTSANKTAARVTAGLLVIVAAVSLCGLNDLLGTTSTEVDVMSGRVRTRTVMFGIVVSESERATRFSQAVARNELPTGAADYRFAYGTTVGLQKLFGTPRISGTYGDALATLDTMMLVFDLRPKLRENERDILGKLLDMLQGADTRGMNDLVDELDPPGGGVQAREHGTDGAG